MTATTYEVQQHNGRCWEAIAWPLGEKDANARAQELMRESAEIWPDRMHRVVEITPGHDRIVVLHDPRAEG
jgi:hypothetical protein